MHRHPGVRRAGSTPGRPGYDEHHERTMSSRSMLGSAAPLLAV